MVRILSSVYDAKILIVDDQPANVALLESILEEEDFENIYSTLDPREVVALQEKEKFDLILLDIRMPHMSGIEVLKQLKGVVKDDYLPVIVLTAQTDMDTRLQALQAGAKDFLSKPFENWEVVLRIKNILETRMFYTKEAGRAETLEEEVSKRVEEIKETHIEIVRRLGAAGEYRDNETGMHVVRMSKVCGIVARAMGEDEQWAEALVTASTMHDVGKIGIPDSVLLKPGKLDDEEWKIMASHVEIGSDIIGDFDSELIQMAKETALYHHEKWDGTGYPHNLKGSEIPLSARIAAISDVFDALTSERPYKKAWTVDEALSVIRKESGKHFDPDVVDAFLSKIDEIVQVRKDYSD